MHGEEVGQHLRGVPLVGEAVVDGDPGEAGQLLHILLSGSPELDGVVHPPEHPCCVGDRLLVPELGARRIEVGHVRALVEGGDLEGRPRTGGGLLEDEGDLLALEPLGFVARILRGLQCLGQRQEVAQLLRLEIDLLHEAPVAQVVHGCPFKGREW